ncbi:MAG: nucleotidyltransferase family protein [Imperialibacter sp.]|jgi:predicted nucleotidyltransferase|uniref:nucleotidyltransferase family protein n=1 Tax=Imperialibacter sp. TaxID=2038411 RepID=UPI0032EA948B
MTTQEIIQRLSFAKSTLFGKYPIKSMAIFGSSARGEAVAESDVDIVVELNGRIGLKFVTIADELEDVLGKKVDLVSRKAIDDRYWKLIEKDLIYV